MRAEKRDTCQTCRGPIHFYPARVDGAEPVVVGETVIGAWAHLNPADWVDNPHPAEPAADEQASA